MSVSAGVISSEKSFRNLDGILSGVVALCGFSFHRSFLTPSVIVKLCFLGRGHRPYLGFCCEGPAELVVKQGGFDLWITIGNALQLQRETPLLSHLLDL